MNCDELLTYLSDYIDQELDEDLTTAAREHLASCNNCHVMLNTTQKTIALHRAQETRVIPAERRERLFTQLQQAFLKQGPEESESM